MGGITIGWAESCFVSSSSGDSAQQVLDEAGPTVSIREAAIVLGCSRDLVYAMHARGELAALGVKVLRLGSRMRVSTASLRRAVEADRP